MSKKEFNSIVKNIRIADQSQVESQLKIANLLCAIKDHKLYEYAGYDNFKMCCQCEFEFTVYSAQGFVQLYRNLKRLGYSESEYLRHMQTVGWRALTNVLNASDKKVGIRKIKSEIANSLRERPQQFNIQFTTDKEALRFEQVLSDFGLDASASGRRRQLKSSLAALLDDYERLKAKERRAKKLLSKAS